jgi:branched-chain amino acid transport system ATP-binding protein
MSAQIMETIRGLAAERGLAVLLVEQNARSALSIADRGVVLSVGRTVAQDSAEALAADEGLRHAYLGL